MQYIFILFLLFVVELSYFKVAKRYKIIDKPNHRSAHNVATIRGGGIVIPIAFLFFLGSRYILNAESNFITDYFLFGTGLLSICTISFADDIMDLSRKIRLIFHFISVTLLLFFLHAFDLMSLWYIPAIYILIIGILNAYNFMDGINGISGLYSIAVLASLLYVNDQVISFVNVDFIIYPLLACIAFLFFNFRKRAICFMGDVGSMGIAFWVIALLGLLMIKTGQIKWILFLSVYGVEVIATILERLKRKENIFEAHRRHLYQLFANDRNVSHLIISFFYAGIQIGINIFVIFSDLKDEWILAMIILPLAGLYLVLKYSVKNRINKTETNED